MVPGRAAGLCQSQNFPDADPQPFLPALKFFEQTAAGHDGAAPFAQLGQVLPGVGVPFLDQFAIACQVLQSIGKRPLLGGSRLDERRLRGAISAALVDLLFERPQSRLSGLAGGRQHLALGLQGAHATGEL